MLRLPFDAKLLEAVEPVVPGPGDRGQLLRHAESSIVHQEVLLRDVQMRTQLTLGRHQESPQRIHTHRQSLVHLTDLLGQYAPFPDGLVAVLLHSLEVRTIRLAYERPDVSLQLVHEVWIIVLRGHPAVELEENEATHHRPRRVHPVRQLIAA